VTQVWRYRERMSKTCCTSRRLLMMTDDIFHCKCHLALFCLLHRVLLTVLLVFCLLLLPFQFLLTDCSSYSLISIGCPLTSFSVSVSKCISSSCGLFFLSYKSSVYSFYLSCNLSESRNTLASLSHTCKFFIFLFIFHQRG